MQKDVFHLNLLNIRNEILGRSLMFLFMVFLKILFRKRLHSLSQSEMVISIELPNLGCQLSSRHSSSVTGTSLDWEIFPCGFLTYTGTCAPKSNKSRLTGDT